MKTQPFLSYPQLENWLDAIKSVRVCLLGDICLDLYWRADMRRSKLSRETPHFPLPIIDETASPGSGGNTAANLAALGIGKLTVLSVLGDDWRGSLLKKELVNRELDISLLVTSGQRVTPCHCKPLRCGFSDVVYEDPRLDFENFLLMPDEDENRILTALDTASKEADVIAVCDQYQYGVITPRIRQRLSEIGQKVPVVVDSRDRIADYTNVIIKPNEVEAAAASGIRCGSLEEAEAAAAVLSSKTGRPVIITLGERGALWYSRKSGAIHIPAIPADPPIDIVGAGDTFLSSFSAVYAAGADGGDAAAFAALASRVTIKKMNTTGTASPDEIKNLYQEVLRYV